MYHIKKNKKTFSLTGNDHFEGISIEREMEIATSTNQPIQRSLTQHFYTRRKDGVLKETDIRTDRFEVAQDAMQHVNTINFAKIAEKNKQTQDVDVPDTTAEH